MQKMLEIRWHGRGGQGAVTAARLLAEAALAKGQYAQAFPEFGPERRGAPVQAFTRLSQLPIRAYYGIADPDAVIVLDPSLLDTVNVAQGLSGDGLLLVNTRFSPGRVREKLGMSSATVCTIDASTVAVECIGAAIPNTAMIGALTRVADVPDVEDIAEYLRTSYASKYSTAVLEGNLKALRRAHQEVTVE